MRLACRPALLVTPTDFRLFNALDLLVVVVTNQRGIARGLMNAAEAAAIHARMVEELASTGGLR